MYKYEGSCNEILHLEYTLDFRYYCCHFWLLNLCQIEELATVCNMALDQLTNCLLSNTTK